MISVLLVVVCSFLRLELLNDLGIRLAFITFFPAVIFATLLRGYASGLLSTLFSCLFVIFWQYPDGSRFLNDSTDWLGLGVFFFNGIVISLFGWKLILFKSKSNQAESLFNIIFENVPISMYIATLDGQIMQANPVMKELVGLQENSIETLSVSDLIYPDDNNICERSFLQLLAGAKTVVFETRYRHQDGYPIWVQVNMFLYTDNKDGQRYVIRQVQDISTRKQAEKLLLEKDSVIIKAQQTLNSILNNLPAMIGYWNNDLTNKFGNQAYIDWFGIEPEKLRGKHLREVIGESLFTLNEPYIQAVMNGKPQLFERTIVDFAGNERYTQASYIPDIVNEQVLGFFVLVTDITELKRAQQSIIKSEASLRAMYDNLPFLAWMKDLEGRYLFANKHWLEAAGITDMTGYKNLTDFDVWPKHLAEHYRCTDLDVMQTQEQKVLTEKALEQGCEIWTETIKAPVIDSYGKLIGTIGLSSDITEKTRAEQKFREYSERLQLASKAAGIGICEWDINTGLAIWDERMYEIFGIHPDIQVDYTIWANAVLPEDLANAKTSVLLLIRGEAEYHFEFRIRRQNDGALRYIQAAAIANYDENGKVSKIIGVNIDISHFKTAEQALRDSETHLAQAQAQTHMGSWSLNIETGSLKWSDECYRIFDVPLGLPLTYDDFISRVHPDDKLLVETAWQAAIKGNVYDIQHRIIVQGNIKWLRERAELIFDQTGQLLFGMGTCQDITELKASEYALNLSKQELRDFIAQREKFREQERKHIAREIHDELGQLLTGLCLEISVLRIGFSNNDEKFLNKINNIVEILDKIFVCTHDLTTSLRPPVIEMGLCSALEWQVRKFSEQTGIKCILDYVDTQENIPEDVSIIIFRIVQESLTNIIKYANATRVEILFELLDNNFNLKITDNGQGFNTNTLRKNHSFGLIGIKERAIMLNGSATVSSEQGKGTSISVCIPHKLAY
jgi:PAS domain S-box-containing protein